MAENLRQRNLLHLHVVVFILGFSGILGKLISLPADSLVWYRMLIGFAGLVAVLMFSGKKQEDTVPLTARLLFFLTGLIVAAHWITFFEAIKVSNVSVTLACFSSLALFTAFIEPVFFKRRVIPYEVLLSVVVIAGLYMIFQFEGQYTEGIIFSLISTFLAALFSVINARFIQKYDAVRISTWEMLGGVAGVTIYLLCLGKIDAAFFKVSELDWLWLLLLGLVCTAYAFVAATKVMRVLTPFTVNMVFNLEPVYSIIIALMIFGDSEKMTWGFYVGAVIILTTIFINTWLKKKKGGQ